MADTEDKGKPSELEVELAVADSGTVEQPAQQTQERPEPVERTDDDDIEAGETAPTTDEERNDRSARRRRQRERKRQQEEQLYESLARQGEIIEQLVGQVQNLSQHTAGGVVAQAEQTYLKARADMKSAYESGDPDKVADATEALNIARLNFDAIKHRRQQQPRRQPEGERQQPRQQANPYQQEWLSRNDWYRDPEKAEDAAIAHAISQTLERVEGYEPNDPALFQELDRRLKKRGIGAPAGAQHTPGKVIVASGQRQSLSPPKKVVISPLAQEAARKFGFDLADKAVAQRIGRRIQNQAAK